MARRQNAARDVVVIGAGASGLAVAHALHAAGIGVRVLEKMGRVAEPWRRRHPRLRLNTHRRLSGLPGMPMPKALGGFPTRDDMVGYLEDYAAATPAPIAFDVEVRKLDKTDGGWRIETPAETLDTAHVVIATGLDRVPHLPAWPGLAGFGGEIVHAADVGDVARARDKHVLVIGAGNSGADLLNHLVRVEPRRVWVSVRHGPVVVPRHLLALPTPLLSPLLDALPLAVADRLLDLTAWLAFGDLRKRGLPRHPTGAATRLAHDGVAPAIDHGFIAALKRGAVEIVPEIARFDASNVRLTDDRTIAPDIVIAATGYRTGLEPMLGHLGILDATGAPKIHGAQQHPRAPGLWFAGMRPPLRGTLNAAGKTARQIADAITREVTA